MSGSADGSAIISEMLPPTTDTLLDDGAVPYFVWDTRETVGEIRRVLAGNDQRHRDELILRLLREANTRDVWVFISWKDIDEAWPRIAHRLGRARGLWDLMRRRRAHNLGEPPP